MRLGNCLAMPNYVRRLGSFGKSRAKLMLSLGDLVNSEKAMDAVFLAPLVPADALEETLQDGANSPLARAPLTIKVSKGAIRRLQARDRWRGE
jgi:enoyl-CoA hydratase